MQAMEQAFNMERMWLLKLVGKLPLLLAFIPVQGLDLAKQDLRLGTLLGGVYNGCKEELRDWVKK